MPEPKTILVAEDYPEALKAMGRMLESKGYKALLADSPATALKMLEEAQGTADLILTDYDMGKENGIDLIKAARKKGYKMPAILISGDLEVDKLERLLKAVKGDNIFLPKSAGPRVLVPLIEKKLSQSQSVGG